jgi:hypothetical protein
VCDRCDVQIRSAHELTCLGLGLERASRALFVVKPQQYASYAIDKFIKALSLFDGHAECIPTTILVDIETHLLEAAAAIGDLRGDT